MNDSQDNLDASPDPLKSQEELDSAFDRILNPKNTENLHDTDSPENELNKTKEALDLYHLGDFELVGESPNNENESTDSEQEIETAFNQITKSADSPPTSKTDDIESELQKTKKALDFDSPERFVPSGEPENNLPVNNVGQTTETDLEKELLRTRQERDDLVDAIKKYYRLVRRQEKELADNEQTRINQYQKISELTGDIVKLEKELGRKDFKINDLDVITSDYKIKLTEKNSIIDFLQNKLLTARSTIVNYETERRLNNEQALSSIYRDENQDSVSVRASISQRKLKIRQLVSKHELLCEQIETKRLESAQLFANNELLKKAGNNLIGLIVQKKNDITILESRISELHENTNVLKEQHYNSRNSQPRAKKKSGSNTSIKLGVLLTFLLSTLWFYNDHNYEPAIAVVASSIALFGLLIESKRNKVPNFLLLILFAIVSLIVFLSAFIIIIAIIDNIFSG